MFEPTTATREQAIGVEVALIEVELARIDARLRTLGWDRPASRRTGTLTWQDFALGVPVEDDDGDDVARQCLQGKRDALLFRLSELRQRLTGPSDRPRGRWG